jgi:hypothetical protein
LLKAKEVFSKERDFKADEASTPCVRDKWELMQTWRRVRIASHLIPQFLVALSTPISLAKKSQVKESALWFLAV